MINILNVTHNYYFYYQSNYYKNHNNQYDKIELDACRI